MDRPKEEETVLNKGKKQKDKKDVKAKAREKANWLGSLSIVKKIGIILQQELKNFQSFLIAKAM